MSPVSCQLQGKCLFDCAVLSLSHTHMLSCLSIHSHWASGLKEAGIEVHTWRTSKTDSGGLAWHGCRRCRACHVAFGLKWLAFRFRDSVLTSHGEKLISYKLVKGKTRYGVTMLSWVHTNTFEMFCFPFWLHYRFSACFSKTFHIHNESWKGCKTAHRACMHTKCLTHNLYTVCTISCLFWCCGNMKCE